MMVSRKKAVSNREQEIALCYDLRKYGHFLYVVPNWIL